MQGGFSEMVIMFVRKEFRTGVAKTFGARLRRFDFQPRFRPKQICPIINFLWQANERFSLLKNSGAASVKELNHENLVCNKLTGVKLSS